MSHNSITFKKRQRETLQKEKAKEKEERRALKKPRAAADPDGVDPDIAGIVPGPQPRAEDD